MSKDFIIGILKKHWWLRGATAAISLIALIQTFIPLDYKDTLRGFHAAITSWNKVASAIGSIISKVPYSPQLTGDQISAITLILSSVVPLTIILWHDTDEESSITEVLTSRALALGLGITHSIALFEMTANKGDPLTNAMSWSFVSTGVLMSCFLIKGYFKGFIHVVVFILSIELMYLLSLPYISDGIKRFSCESIKGKYEGCALPI